MGEDNIFVNGYTAYYNGQPLGYISEGGVVEEPDVCYIFSFPEFVSVLKSYTTFASTKSQYMNALYSVYKKKNRIKKK